MFESFLVSQLCPLMVMALGTAAANGNGVIERSAVADLHRHAEGSLSGLVQLYVSIVVVVQ
eukprot:3389317-Amphidinium_carterae.1